MSVKLIVMGVGGVGKSAITNRFVINRWVEKYDPTIEESYSTTVDVDGKALQVEILDTAGQDEYAPLRETFMHTGDGFLFVYSLTDDQTLEELRTIREQVLRVHPNRNVSLSPFLIYILIFRCKTTFFFLSFHLQSFHVSSLQTKPT